MDNPLKDLKIVELASVLAGPAVGMFFSELGAEVIKIENPLQNGDVTRSWRGPNETTEGPSAYFSAINYAKQHVFLNLKDNSDRQKVLDHIEHADIVISNFRPKSAQNLGLDYTSLKKKFPKLIYGEISGFANSDRPAFDAVLQAETGFMGINGHELPTKMPVALIDILAAHQLKEGLLVALISRYKTGQGAKVSVSLQEAAISSLCNVASNYLMNGTETGRLGSLHPNIAPYGEILEFKGGEALVLAIGNQKQFTALFKLLGIAAIELDHHFTSNQLRVKNRKQLHLLMNAASKRMQFDFVYKECLALNIPVGAIKTIKEVLSDPLAKKITLEELIEGRTTLRIRGNVFKIES